MFLLLLVVLPPLLLRRVRPVHLLIGRGRGVRAPWRDRSRGHGLGLVLPAKPAPCLVEAIHRLARDRVDVDAASIVHGTRSVRRFPPPS